MHGAAIGNVGRRTVLAAAAALMLSRPGVARADGRHYPTRMDDAGIDAVFERASEELRLKTQAHVGAWQADEASWSVDLDKGEIEFRNPKGWVITAPVQFIGTFLTTDNSFLWGWDHPSAPEPVRDHAKLVRAFGETQGLAALTTRKIETTEADCWQFTALAAHLAGATGAYRAPVGKAMAFFTYGTVTITKP
ncbi:DUF6882 domain-containing protein [Sphingomonas sp. ST-64]|uniref:DUF6882 domain-containing protein n=1 Tax=Sphingomonas plantiphila TaxID=3163295 RepID=A0ABW8YLI9_9SPHN